MTITRKLRTRRTTLAVLDADSHLTDVDDLWTKRAPAKYKDEILHVEQIDGQRTGSSRARSWVRPAAAAPSTRPASSTPSWTRWSSGTSRRRTWRLGHRRPPRHPRQHGDPAPGALPQRPRAGGAGRGRGEGPGPAPAVRRDLQRLPGRDPEQHQQPPPPHADPARLGHRRLLSARPSGSPNWACAGST